MNGGDAPERPPRSLGDSLERLAGELGFEAHARAVAVLEHWPTVAGPEVAEHADPLHLRDGVLTVSVDEPAWATHLRYLGPNLAADLNAAVGAEVVVTVNVVVGRP